MQTLSKAIIERISSAATGTNGASPNGRIIQRSAPISSSRDDPLPNPNDIFPAPLPQVTLPYELSLLDNLFINPMSSHNKASDYTNGNKARCQNKSATDTKNNISGSSTAAALSSTLTATPQGFPPSAFGGAGLPLNNIDPGLMGIQAYGMAAQMGQNAGVSAMNTNNKFQPSTDIVANQTMGIGAAPTDTGFDLLSFLMDEEGGLGTTWDALDVPADYSLWS